MYKKGQRVDEKKVNEVKTRRKRKVESVNDPRAGIPYRDFDRMIWSRKKKCGVKTKSRTAVNAFHTTIIAMQ